MAPRAASQSKTRPPGGRCLISGWVPAFAGMTSGMGMGWMKTPTPPDPPHTPTSPQNPAAPCYNLHHAKAPGLSGRPGSSLSAAQGSPCRTSKNSGTRLFTVRAGCAGIVGDRCLVRVTSGRAGAPLSICWRNATVARMWRTTLSPPAGSATRGGTRQRPRCRPKPSRTMSGSGSPGGTGSIPKVVNPLRLPPPPRVILGLDPRAIYWRGAAFAPNAPHLRCHPGLEPGPILRSLNVRQVVRPVYLAAVVRSRDGSPLSRG